MAKKTEFERAKERLVELAHKREELEELLAETNLQVKAMANYLWTMEESKDDDGNPVKVIDLGELRVERRVRPSYDSFLFEGDCRTEFAELREKSARKAFENYSPTQSEMEAVYNTRKDGEDLRKRHLIENSIAFAIAKNPQ